MAWSRKTIMTEDLTYYRDYLDACVAKERKLRDSNDPITKAMHKQILDIMRGCLNKIKELEAFNKASP